ncbi:MAG: FimB/Mfa2 family fimbrial subunit [Alistipes sp.]|nr:FimB/Mfa2 family fimbrial subunit [Alistipes sp.]
MKSTLYPMLIALAAIAVASCSIKEDMESCTDPPRSGMDTLFVYLVFECIEIYDAGEREIVFDKVTDQLELLFYDTDGKLAYDLKYTAARLEEYDWEVRLYTDLVKPGDYTLLTLVNYDNDHYTLTGKESLETLLAGLEHDSSEIDFPLTDTYYGRYELELRYSLFSNEHKVMLSKNTNLFNLTVTFRDEENYNNVISMESRITGNNTLYRWDNTAVDLPAVRYIPFRSSYGDRDKTFNDFNKTMRIWHASDLKLEIELTTTHEVYKLTQDIPQWLAEIEKYDTDEKLEHYDEFDIRITLGGGFVILAVQVNGWYVVKDEGDL